MPANAGISQKPRGSSGCSSTSRRTSTGRRSGLLPCRKRLEHFWLRARVGREGRTDSHSAHRPARRPVCSRTSGRRPVAAHTHAHPIASRLQGTRRRHAHGDLERLHGDLRGEAGQSARRSLCPMTKTTSSYTTPGSLKNPDGHQRAPRSQNKTEMRARSPTPPRYFDSTLKFVMSS